MGEVSAQIQMQAIDDNFGWTYSQWTIDYGKGRIPDTEHVKIKCSETSQRYMSKEEAFAEAQGRIRVKIRTECGDFPEDKIKWECTESA
ncbi:MAG: hypothetical protein JSU59_10045 [Nitrospirota bacterium]|nr:MAG: hypothetical protein JSU59_10045 [Nitrospirota bacterium]